VRLLITTPAFIVIDDPKVAAVRAEDESGSFGILDGHADLLTALTVSVMSWHRADGRQRFCAVRAAASFPWPRETKCRLRPAKRSRAMTSNISNKAHWRMSQFGQNQSRAPFPPIAAGRRD